MRNHINSNINLFRSSPVDNEDNKKQKYKDLIKGYFVENKINQQHDYKSNIQKLMQSIIEQFFGIIVHYFANYSEEMFHQRMNNSYILIDKESGKRFELRGFDFIGDWRKFHKVKFIFFIKAVRLNKNLFIFNEEKIYDVLLGLLETKGWQVTELEKQGMKDTVHRLYNILYNKRDTMEWL